MGLLKSFLTRVVRLLKDGDTAPVFGRRYRVLNVERCEVSGGPPPPMRWIPCHPSTITTFKATMTCPEGHTITLRHHSIAPDGAVTPSVVCKTHDCSFHSFVRLVGWTFGEVKASLAED
jgi:hypothetical protein